MSNILKPMYIGILVLVVATTFFCYRSQFQEYVVYSAGNGEGKMPQSGDLCNGTGGNGQIASVGANSFTLARNDGKNEIVNLARQATIKTSAGTGSVADLKTGERVTLVGDQNPGDSFTADTVVVCNATTTGTPITVRKDHTDSNSLDTTIALSKVLFFGLIWLGSIAFLRLKKKESLVYLLFFTIFYIYLYKVLDYTLFQFQSLVFEKYFMPDLILRGVAAGKSLNLIPLITLRLEDIRTSLLNILLMIPFGFGLPFISKLRMKKIIAIGMLFSITIEFLQFITGFLAKITFRIADINDVLFNTVGVAIGYILFIGFVRIFHHLLHNHKIAKNPILRYILSSRNNGM